MLSQLRAEAWLLASLPYGSGLRRLMVGRARALQEMDVRERFGRVYLPYALARKYPNADRVVLAVRLPGTA